MRHIHNSNVTLDKKTHRSGVERKVREHALGVNEWTGK